MIRTLNSRGGYLGIATLYGVPIEFLRGNQSLDDDFEKVKLLEPFSDPIVRRGIGEWYDFLERWAAQLRTLEETKFGAGRPPRALDEKEIITDVRRAPTLAMKVREYYGMGEEGLFDLYALLEGAGVLVYRAPLGSLETAQEGVSGAFYNYPQLGYSVLVNTDTTRGRQTFTLAHEFAHALYHYPSTGGIISRKGDRDPRETFANAFASHFLVPGKALRDRIKEMGGKDQIDHLQVYRRSRYFRVSYAMLLYRLFNEGVITPEQLETWKWAKVSEMEKLWKVSPNEHDAPENDSSLKHSESRAGGLERYPISVLKRVQSWIHGSLFLNQEDAVKLLDVSVYDLQHHLLNTPERAKSSDLQIREVAELPF